MFGSKPPRITFDEVDGFIRVYDGIRYLALLGHEKYDAISNRVRYLISQKSGITHIISHNYATIKDYSYNSLTLEKFKIVIKSVFNKDKNHYYYNIFLEKCSCK